MNADFIERTGEYYEFALLLKIGWTTCISSRAQPEAEKLYYARIGGGAFAETRLMA